jgi:uncharacterized RDD family membrane protein YckC
MVFRRILAYMIDYLVIVCYAGLLFLVTYVIHMAQNRPLEMQDPITGNIISFLTLTMPVFLYFFLFESSSKKGTFGKQLVKIIIDNNKKKNVLLRVIFKIIPWEMAHVGIHWSVYYSEMGKDIPLWTWIVNIIPQVVVIMYFLSIALTKGRSSLYDKIANTSVMPR